jgi:hypothetical protein
MESERRCHPIFTRGADKGSDLRGAGERGWDRSPARRCTVDRLAPASAALAALALFAFGATARAEGPDCRVGPSVCAFAADLDRWVQQGDVGAIVAASRPQEAAVGPDGG